MIKRLCDLKKGEFFLWIGTSYTVYKITDTQIEVRHVSIINGVAHKVNGMKSYFGINCQMRVEVIECKLPATSQKAVIQMDKNGNEIASYKSMAIAAIAVGLNDGNGISDAVHGRQRTSGGFRWKLKVA